MIKSKKTKLATAVGTAAMAMALSAPANAAISLGGSDGWEVTYGGFINLFYNQLDSDTAGDSAHLNEGLLPAFHTFTVKSPTVNGLTGTGQITFAPDSSSGKTSGQNKKGDSIDMREVFFNVEGSFGTISAGRTLSLYQRQAILQDYTLFGVGASAGVDGSGTSLGRIGFGYVYPEFNTRFVYQTNVMNGFQLSVGIFDPIEGSGANASDFESDVPQFQTEATYNGTFGGGSFNLWAGGIWQEIDGLSNTTAGALKTTSGDVTSSGFDVGGAIDFGGFNVGGHYYDGEAIGVLRTADISSFVCTATNCSEADNDGYYVQGSYTFNGKTKVGGGYGSSQQDSDGAGNIEIDNTVWTVGVYHDVNSWLKLVAEYNDQESTIFGDIENFSVGGFLLW